ncbi:hypothetical protein BH11VER1_BH11VER1_08860 [soil metagenome]
MNTTEIRAPRPPTRRSNSGLGFLLVVIAFAVGAAALAHILTKNKTHGLGKQQGVAEREIVAMEQEARDLNMKIEESLSRKNLTDRLIAQRSKLKVILPDNIIRISSTSPPSSKIVSP